jgi:hypothetical protein
MTLDDKIIILLTPGIGRKMAESFLTKECEALGISRDQITKEHLPILAKNISEAVSIFIGSMKADDLEQMLKELE